jgi:predicted permease
MTPKRLSWFTRTAQRDVDEEIAFHFAARIEDLIAGGMSPDEARRRANEEFGDVAPVRDSLLTSTRRRAARRTRIDTLRDLGDDLAYVARSVRRAPAFALAVALTLGLGIGATATMYGVVDRLLLRGPEHVVEPQKVRRVYAQLRTETSGDLTTSTFGYAAYAALRDGMRTATSVAAYYENEGRVGHGVNATAVQIGAATASFFPLLGVHPLRGRFFDASDDAPSNPASVVVLDYGYWAREFASSDSAIGRAITIDGQRFTIIGVAPRGFTGAELRPVDLWIPVSAGQHPRPDWPTTWRAQWLTIVARRAPGVSATQMDDDITRVFRGSYGGPSSAWHSATLSARDIAFTRSGVERPEASIARWLTAVALLVLVIAGANVANLLLVRSFRRHQESAVRLALGISRGRLSRLLILESLAFAVLGGVAGLIAAHAGGVFMRRVFLPSVAWNDAPVSGRVLLGATVLTIVLGVVIGLAPIAQAWSTDLAGALRGLGAQDVRPSRLRRGLLVVQVAFSTTLLVGAGLFIRSLSNVQHLDLGVEPDRVLVVAIDWARTPNATAEVARGEQARAAERWRELRERVAHTPGVDDAALAVGSPFGYGFGVDVTIPGQDSLPADPGGGPYVNAVGAHYFTTVGTPLVRGRAFTSADGPGTTRVAIVNETMASLVWPNAEPIGKCLIIQKQGCSVVVGVVRDARRNALREPAAMQYYIPFGQESGFGGTTLMVRPRGDARAFENTLRSVVVDQARDASALNLYSMQDRVDPQVRPWRLGAAMFGLFGAAALLVAAIGLYSAIAYATAQREREFGIRLAIGASATRLVRDVLYDGLRVAAVGVAVGVALALVTARRIAPLLFDVSARDPLVFGAVAVALLIVALLASLVPAWRAGGTDPVAAMRSS